MNAIVQDRRGEIFGHDGTSEGKQTPYGIVDRDAISKISMNDSATQEPMRRTGHLRKSIMQNNQNQLNYAAKSA